MSQPDLIQQQRDSLNAAPITPTGWPSPVAEALPTAVQRIAEALQPEKSSSSARMPTARQHPIAMWICW
jgi:hypothetical protein